jgi:hypothetical protein
MHFLQISKSAPINCSDQGEKVKWGVAESTTNADLTSYYRQVVVGGHLVVAGHPVMVAGHPVMVQVTR